MGPERRGVAREETCEKRGEESPSRIGGEEKSTQAHAVALKAITERLQRTYMKNNMNLYSKAGFTVRSVVVSPKDSLYTGKQFG